jgi:hypothetical protein
MLSPNALYDSSYYAMSTLEIPILYFTGESDCARSTFSNALNLFVHLFILESSIF